MDKLIRAQSFYSTENGGLKYPPSPQIEVYPEEPKTEVTSSTPIISNLNRQVFNKDKFNETVDTSFSQLGVTEQDPSFFDVNLATIEDFFTLYNKFFFEIPKEGDTNSHIYLINESSQYVDYQQNNEEIQALLQEITELRQENLVLRQEQIDLIVQQNS